VVGARRDVWREHEVVVPQRPVGRQRLLREHVQRRARDPCSRSVGQRRLVDQRSRATLISPPLHQLQRARIDELRGLRGRRGGEQHVSFRQQRELRRRHRLSTGRAAAPVNGDASQHAAAERARTPCDLMLIVPSPTMPSVASTSRGM
jgi:hypothetical protein